MGKKGWVIRDNKTGYFWYHPSLTMGGATLYLVKEHAEVEIGMLNKNRYGSLEDTEEYEFVVVELDLPPPNPTEFQFSMSGHVKTTTTSRCRVCDTRLDQNDLYCPFCGHDQRPPKPKSLGSHVLNDGQDSFYLYIALCMAHIIASVLWIVMFIRMGA